MDAEKAGNDNMHLTEQELFMITEEMCNEMNEVYKKASQFPEHSKTLQHRIRNTRGCSRKI
ncbi:MAG: hypothetical protein JXJ04_24625 [Spirochaetales bacterium]|nr:hypothetical protein [Spirochaetales bacterium]